MENGGTIRLKRPLLLYILVLSFLLPMVSSAAIPVQKNTFVPLDAIDIWIDGWTTRYYYWSSLDTSDTIYVDIEVTSGSGIDFWICDDYNYGLWCFGFSCDAYYVKNDVGSVSVTFRVPYSDEWRVVFHNDDLLTSKHIEGWVGLSPSPSSLASSALLVGLGIIAVAAIGVGGCVKATQRNRKPGINAGQQTYYASESYSSTSAPPVVDNIRFCPYCGAPKQNYDAQFCSRCGRAFKGPDVL
jgi:hypothetical protein